MKNIEIKGYSKICELKDLPEKRGARFFVNDIDIAVFKIEGEVFAVDNVCPHNRSAIIYDGFVEGKSVACPAHGWEFDLKTGELKSGYKGLKTYPVMIIDSAVYLKTTLENI